MWIRNVEWASYFRTPKRWTFKDANVWSHAQSRKFPYLVNVATCVRPLQVAVLLCTLLYGTVNIAVVLIVISSPGRPEASVKQRWCSWFVIILWLLSCVQLFATPRTVACQAPPSVEFTRQEYWSGLSFPSPGGLSHPGIEPACPALQTGCLSQSNRGSPGRSWYYCTFQGTVL